MFDRTVFKNTWQSSLTEMLYTFIIIIIIIIIILKQIHCCSKFWGQ